MIQLTLSLGNNSSFVAFKIGCFKILWVCVCTLMLCVCALHVCGRRKREKQCKKKTKQNTKLNAVDHEDNMKP